MSRQLVNRPHLALAFVVAATLLGLAGTDLILPAVPALPDVLGGNTATAQHVLAAYAGGTALGLLLFGALGDRFGTRSLISASLLLTSVTSLACALAPTIEALVVLRGLQGAAASGPAVFAPAIVRTLFEERQAIRALGALGSIESLAPALAPIAGIWLLGLGGWSLSFELMAAFALILAALNLALPLLPQTDRRVKGSYARLLRDPVYLRYALSQAFVLAGLLIFVFGAPALMVRALGGSLTDFIVMQVSGVAAFILFANSAGGLAARFGTERMISIGTATAAAGGLLMLGYALVGGADPLLITLLLVPVGGGLGLRGPPGFYRAIVASRGDEARGGALIILFIMAAASIGTALVAPFIEQGLVPLAAATCALECAALACLLLPGLRQGI